MIKKIICENRDAWLSERRKSLGGSDMGAVLGLNEYASPYSVWADKTGRLAPKEYNEAMRLGNDLEGYVADRFAEVSGFKLRNDKATWRNDKYPHLHANCDRVIVGRKEGLECKTTSTLNEKKYRDGKFIDSYYAQCVTYLAVTEFKRWYLAVLIFGVGLRIYQMTRIENDVKPDWCESSVYVSDDEIKALNTAAEDFWVHVETDTPPEVDGNQATTKSLGEVFSYGSDTVCNLNAYEHDVERYLSLGKEIRRLEHEQDECANRIKAFMGESSKGECSNYTVNWNMSMRNTFDYKAYMKDHPGIDLARYFRASTGRTFRINEKKEK